MLKISVDLQRRFDSILEEKKIPEIYRTYYQKWLRFYLDFCLKYGYSNEKQESFIPFSEKLKEKRQNDMQIKQASHAISLYHEMIQPIGENEKNNIHHHVNLTQRLDTENSKREEERLINFVPCSTNEKNKDEITPHQITPQQTRFEHIKADFDALLNQKHIPDQCHPYYRKWVQYYFDICLEYGYSPNQKESLPFYATILTKELYADWQVKQANHAVSLYYNIIREKNNGDIKNHRDISANRDSKRDSESLSQPPSNSKGMFDNSHSNTKRDLREKPVLSIKTPGNNLNSWEFALQRLYEEIKVRHYSPKTFKVYSHWLAKFQTFTHSKPIESLEDSGV